MIATNYSHARDNLKAYMDSVTEDFETVVITRKNNQNVVMISEVAYNNLLENLHLMGEKANYDWLMESKNQLNKGNAKARSLVEVDNE